MTSTDDQTGSNPVATRNPARRRPIPPPPPSRSAAPPPPPTARSRAVDASGVGGAVTRADQTPTTLIVRPWLDPLVDESGHDARSRYVELFWLGVLGPTGTWLLRRLVAGLERHPAGYEIDLELTASLMGMSYTAGRSSPFSKALHRCTMFGLAHQTSDGIAVRRKIPMVAHRHLRRMPDAVRRAHDEWVSAEIDVDEFDRAHRLALVLLESGDDAATIEHHLVALGVTDGTAAQVADNAARL